MSAPGQRALAVDALRGLTVAAMILVNNPGDWGHAYAPLRHAPWHGCTPTDLVFPTFLFLVGVSIPLAFDRRLAAGEPRSRLHAKILRRAGILLLLGLLLNAWPFVTLQGGLRLDPDLARLRFPGVLQRIALCYLGAAWLYLHAGPRALRAACAACLLGYWALLTLVPVPGFGAGMIDAKDSSLAAWLDRAVFGTHVWKQAGVYDPEGLLSTIPALATTLLGVLASRLLHATPIERAARLLVWGSSLCVLGYAWSWVLPLNKPLWTSSYAVLTAGLAAAALGVATWLVDVRGHTALVAGLRTYGINAITVFVGSGLLADLLGLLPVGERSLKGWLHETWLASWLPAYPASLAYALLWVLAWYGVLRAMERRGIVLRV